MAAGDSSEESAHSGTKTVAGRLPVMRKAHLDPRLATRARNPHDQDHVLTSNVQKTHLRSQPGAPVRLRTSGAQTARRGDQPAGTSADAPTVQGRVGRGARLASRRLQDAPGDVRLLTHIYEDCVHVRTAVYTCPLDARAGEPGLEAWPAFTASVPRWRRYVPQPAHCCVVASCPSSCDQRPPLCGPAPASAPRGCRRSTVRPVTRLENPYVHRTFEKELS